MVWEENKYRWGGFVLLVHFLGQSTTESNLVVPQKVIELPYDPVVLLLGIYSEDLKAGTHT